MSNIFAHAGALNAVLMALGFMPFRTYTWAGKPAANAVRTGTIIRVSDVGPAPGIRVVSDGTSWRPDGVQVLARSAVAVSGAADTNENTLATITVPAGLMGVDGSIRVWTTWTVTNNANVKTARVRFGGTSMQNPALTSTAGSVFVTTITNRAATNSQMSQGATSAGVGNSAGGLAIATADTTAGVTVLLTAEKATAGDTMTLQRYLVEILP